MFGPADGVTACLFDMDGVITQTAVVHATAWKEMFDEFLRQRAEETGTGFAKERGLRGKPAPDTFLAAAEELGVPSARAAVFEDALAGVEAGRAGHFALVVGVDRVGQAGELRKHGADIVVRDLIDLLDQDAQPDMGAR
jgi:beta-phosphoglucomutase-like phosphatase (HAD superfamily)